MFERYPIRQLLAPAIAAALLAACGAGDTADDRPAAEPAPPPVDPATAAVITGAVHFEGEPPALAAIDMSAEPNCAEVHADAPVQAEVVVNDNGTLRNVFVYVKEGPLDGLQFPAPAEPAVIDQAGCIYKPRVLGVQAGQQILIRNSDGLLHNINARPEVNRGFNISQPRSMETRRDGFRMPEVMIPFRCDVHGWMIAYIGVLDHPYFAVTDETGSVRFDQLPPGDYVIEAWHERYGTQTTDVTVGPSGTAEVSFTFAAQ